MLLVEPCALRTNLSPRPLASPCRMLVAFLVLIRYRTRPVCVRIEQEGLSLKLGQAEAQYTSSQKRCHATKLVEGVVGHPDQERSVEGGTCACGAYRGAASK